MEDHRQRIRDIDTQIVRLLEERHELVLKLWEKKRTQGISLKDKQQEEKIIQELSAQSSLSSEAIRAVYHAIFDQN